MLSISGCGLIECSVKSTSGVFERSSWKNLSASPFTWWVSPTSSWNFHSSGLLFRFLVFKILEEDVKKRAKTAKVSKKSVRSVRRWRRLLQEVSLLQYLSITGDGGNMFFWKSFWCQCSLSDDVLIVTQIWPRRLEATSWLTPRSLFLLSILLLAGSVRRSLPLCAPLTALLRGSFYLQVYCVQWCVYKWLINVEMYWPTCPGKGVF